MTYGRAALASEEAAQGEHERMRRALHDIAEEWAGAECGEPVHAQEAYAIGLAKRMYQLATDGLGRTTELAKPERSEAAQGEPSAAQPAPEAVQRYALAAQPAADLATRAIEELHQLGYTIRDGLLYPPEPAAPEKGEPPSAYRYFGGMCWAVPGERMNELARALTFAPETHVFSMRERLVLRSFLDAYRELVSLPKRHRDMRVRELRQGPGHGGF